MWMLLFWVTKRRCVRAETGPGEKAFHQNGRPRVFMQQRRHQLQSVRPLHRGHPQRHTPSWSREFSHRAAQFQPGSVGCQLLRMDTGSPRGGPKNGRKCVAALWFGVDRHGIRLVCDSSFLPLYFHLFYDIDIFRLSIGRVFIFLASAKVVSLGSLTVGSARPQYLIQLR